MNNLWKSYLELSQPARILFYAIVIAFLFSVYKLLTNPSSTDLVYILCSIIILLGSLVQGYARSGKKLKAFQTIPVLLSLLSISFIPLILAIVTTKFSISRVSFPLNPSFLEYPGVVARVSFFSFAYFYFSVLRVLLFAPKEDVS